MSAALSSRGLTSSLPCRTLARSKARVSSGNRTVKTACAARPMWLPGFAAPAHLDGSMPGDFGFDPLNLGADPEALTWYKEAELQHARWAMMGVAGILGQEAWNPDVFFYDAATKADLPFPILGIVGVQFLLMHYVELRRWRDVVEPNSVNQDPIFSDQELPEHEPGYPGGIFDPFNFAEGDLEAMKKREIKNGRLAMLAFLGFVVQAQSTGLGPIACWKLHLSSPYTTTIVNYGLYTPSTTISPGCKIDPITVFEGISIPTPCLPLWP